MVLTIFAGLVSTAFALLMRDEPRSQLRFGAFVFFCFIASAFILGWIMFPFPS
jgi:hypothetical protein